MAETFQNAIKGAQRVIRGITAQSVRYERGSLSAVILGIPATSETDQQIEETYRVSFTINDFLIMKDDLDDFGFGAPQRGDKITVIVNDIDTDIYEVMPTEVLPIWTWADTYHQEYRIHCKKVAS